MNEIGGNDLAADYMGRSGDSQANCSTDAHGKVYMERIILIFFFPLSCQCSLNAEQYEEVWEVC